MPWSNQTGGGGGGGWKSGGGGPWGQGGSGQGPQRPDLEEILKTGQDRLKNIIPGGSNKLIWLLAPLVIVGFLVFRGVYTVQPDEIGIELMFGKAKQEINEPGLHYHFWPIETVETPKALAVHKDNIGFSSSGQASAESLMLTGDQNIVSVEFTVLWRISDPRAYLFNIRAQRQLVRLIAESSMREHVGRNRAEVIRTTGRDEAQETVQALTQKILDGYAAGIRIVGVRIEKADPPPAVSDAFEEVQRAKQDQDRFLEEAQKYANKILGRARGKAARLGEQAKAYEQRVVAEATGEAKRFVAVYDEYIKARDVTRKRLFIETMENVMSKSNKVIIEQDAGSGVVPYLPLPEIQKRQGSATGRSAGGNQ